MQRGSSSSNTRGDVERERRQRMNAQYSRLASLIPKPSPSKENRQNLQRGVLLDQATSYVVKLKQNVEELKRREKLLRSEEDNQKDRLISPALTITEMGSTLVVNLITRVQNNNFRLHRALLVLEEEGLEVLSVSQSAVGRMMLYTINSQVVYTRIGIETSRMYERLKKLVC